MCTSGHGLTAAGYAFTCLQGVPFREEDKTALQDAQSELRHRVAGFVREHKDHYVRLTPFITSAGHSTLAVLGAA